MTFGLNSTGFVPMQQQDIISAIQTALQTAFGQNINLLNQSVFGQLVNIFSEREALLWQLAEAIYASQYPTGAEGTSVDNILALNGLTRLPATATVTAPTSTSGTPGLVCYGTPGTIIPAGSIISKTATPTVQVTVDSDITIGAAANEVQQVTFYGGPPTSGNFALSIVDTLGVTRTTSSIPYTASNTTVQSAIRALTGYSGVTVAGTFAAGFTLTFGGGAGSLVQNLFTVASNSLLNSTTVVNINVTRTTTGKPSEGIGSATCTVTGPTYIPAGYLTVIGSPVSGWTSVTNPLDCITGSDLETDTAALTRRASLLSANASGTLPSIIEAVSQLTGVVQTVGFENTSLAAQQVVTITGTPSAGYFTLGFTGPGGMVLTTGYIPWNALANIQQVTFSGVPPSGSFTLSFGSVGPTAAINYNATAATVQSAIRALTGYSSAVVTGNFTSGFSIAFGAVKQLPVSAANSLGGGVNITVITSVQSQINNVSAYSQALVTGSYASSSFVIAFNGSAGGQAQVLANPNNQLTGVSTITVTNGRAAKSFEIVVNDNNGEVADSLIAQTIFDLKPAGMQAYGTTTVEVLDAYGNPYNIGFSRPTQVPIYVSIVLQTDLLTSTTPAFNVSSIATIQQDVVTIGNASPIGGTVVGFGSNGLIGAFNNVPGILSYTMYFGASPTPTQNANISLLPEQVAQFETSNVLVSYT